MRLIEIVVLQFRALFGGVKRGGLLAPELSEFDAAGLTREPSRTVRPPRVAESPAALECRLHRIIPVGNSFLVLGEVVHAAVRTDVLSGTHPDARLLRPLARLGRNEWSTLGEILAIDRIPYRDWPARP